MSDQPGFVPIRFALAGRILITLGVAVVTAFLISKLTAWFPLAWVFGLVGLFLILIGLYLVYIVPKEPK
jgi:hypothetical protein